MVYAVCCFVCAAVGAVFDVATRRIPNAFTLPALLLGVAIHFALGGWPQVGFSLAAGLGCGLIFLLFHLAGGMGGGDVKLMAAAGCTAGLHLAGPLLSWTALAGGAMAIGVALYHGRLAQTLGNLRTLAAHHGSAGLKPHPELHVGNAQTLRLPYALAITAGSLVSLCLVLGSR